MMRSAREPKMAVQPGNGTLVHPERAPASEIEITTLPGLVPYLPMWRRQQALAAARARGEIGDQLLFVEHEHVYTNGWRGDRSNLLADDATLREIGASYHEIERGGDITYHGPGQMVAYPIIDLRAAGIGVRAYVNKLETTVIHTLAAFGVEAKAKSGIVGVWVGEAKIAAVGVKVRHGITYHGFALNVNPDLDYFSHIVPCGLTGVTVTSLSAVLNRPVEISAVIPACARAFREVMRG